MDTARNAAVLILLLVAALALPTAADAQQRAATLALGVTVPPEVGISSAGDAVVAWFASDDRRTARQRGIGSIFVTSRDARGRLGTPRRLAPSGYASHAFALAVGSAGDAAIVLRRRGSFRQPGGPLRVARRVPGGRFGPLAAVPGLQAVNRPAAAMGSDGTLLVGWLARAPRGCSGVVHATVARRGRPFGRARRISGPCPHAAPPRAALGAGGRGAVAWLEGGFNRRLAAAPVSGGRLGRAAVVGSRVTGYAGAFGLGSGDDGRALIVWRELTASLEPEPPGRVLAATVGDSGPARPMVVSASDRVMGPASVAVAHSGAALAAWQEGDFRQSSVVVARRAAGSEAFTSPEVVHPCGVYGVSSKGAVAAVASGGEAAVGFHSSCLERFGVRPSPDGLAVARAPAGGSFGPPLPLAAGYFARRVRIALADAGPGIVAWTQQGRLQVLGL
jgi:hypothetical protein